MTAAAPAASARLIVVGDVILNEPEPRRFFERSTDVLRSADLVVGNVEVPHTRRPDPQPAPVPAVPAPPEHLEALRWAGFGVGTLAGNHVYDCGTNGVLDTRAALLEYGITPVGAGRDVDEAWQPAVVSSGGRTWGVLAVNCVGPRSSWARPDRAGCAYVGLRSETGEPVDDPGASATGPALTNHVDPDDVEHLQKAVVELHSHVDVVVVAMHKGVVHTPAVVLPYEREVAQAAIDAGADVVAAHHAHILRGIEIYHGRPIFHGLGNWVTVTRALNPGEQDDAAREAWARRRLELFGFTPDPAMPSYPFHPDSRNTMIGMVEVASDGNVRAGFVPCWIDDEARPVPCDRRSARHADVTGYVTAISREAGFDTQFTTDAESAVVWASRPGT